MSRVVGIYREVLSPRELKDVLPRLARGLTNQEIADELGIGLSTVKSHVDRIVGKLGGGNRAKAVHEALVRGLVVVVREWSP